MRSLKTIRAATLTAIAAGLVVTACTASPGSGPRLPAELADGGSACVGDCPTPLTSLGLAEGWASIGEVPLPGGRVPLGPGGVSGGLNGNPTVEQEGLTPEQQAQFVPVLVEALRTPWDPNNPRVAGIAEGIYGGLNRPGLSDLFAPLPPGAWVYPDDLYSAPVTIQGIEKTSDYPQAQITLTANLPVVDRDTGARGTWRVERTVEVTLMDSWILDWTRSTDTLGSVEHVDTPSILEVPGSGSGSVGDTETA